MSLNSRRFFSNNVGLYDILLAIAIGLRFDARIAAYAALPTVLCTLSGTLFLGRNICSPVRKSMLYLFFFLSTAICIINFAFISEYKDNFNQWVFGVIYDDFGAVAKSVVKESHLFVYGAIACAMSYIIAKLSIGFLAKPFVNDNSKALKVNTAFRKTMVSVVLLTVFIFAIRGSMGMRPVQLKDAGVTKDPFLNKLILNPYSALRYALKDYFKILSSAGIKTFLPDKDVKGAAKRYFSTSKSHDDIDEYFKKITTGHNPQKPRQIFLIIMEGLDSWPLLKQYQSFSLLPNLSALGEKGVLIKAFLPASTGTMSSFAPMITGIPDADTFINYQPLARSPFPTSMAPQFKKLGYETNMFYGGYLSWQRMGDFCKAQGFDHVFGGGDMGKWQNKEWGVDDNVLFEFVADRIDEKSPSFNVILTTSNHTPYDLPVYEKGFPYHDIPENLKNIYSKEVPLKVFGHLWYSDRLLKEFIEKIEKKFPNSLFAVTGDHWSRKHISTTPSLYERSSVPLLLYGKGISHKNGNKLAGSHMDIMPTLIELSAPYGFTYYSMGRDLLNNVQNPMGFSRNCIITKCYIIDDNNSIEKLPFVDNDCEKLDLTDTIKLLNAYRGIGWWRVMKGAKLGYKQNKDRNNSEVSGIRINNEGGNF